MRNKTEQIFSGALTRKILGWDAASDAARQWWGELENMNEGREDLVIKLIGELMTRQATIEDFFLACSYSGREGVSENLRFLDMIRQDTAGDPEQENDDEPFLH